MTLKNFVLGCILINLLFFCPVFWLHFTNFYIFTLYHWIIMIPKRAKMRIFSQDKIYLLEVLEVKYLRGRKLFWLKMWFFFHYLPFLNGKIAFKLMHYDLKWISYEIISLVFHYSITPCDNLKFSLEYLAMLLISRK